MKKRIGWAVAAGAVSLAALAGCGQSSTTGTGTSAPASVSSSSATAQSGLASPSASSATDMAATPDLKTAGTSLGTVVVDGKGMTVYYYDKDTPNSGKSTCNAGCITAWPAVPAASSTPVVDGVTGTVGTITRDDGTLQVTINGLPVYTYAKDTKAGDVTGQGVGGIWWVVAPNGDKVTTTSAATSPSGTGSGY